MSPSTEDLQAVIAHLRALLDEIDSGDLGSTPALVQRMVGGLIALEVVAAGEVDLDELIERWSADSVHKGKP